MHSIYARGHKPINRKSDLYSIPIHNNIPI